MPHDSSVGPYLDPILGRITIDPKDVPLYGHLAKEEIVRLSGIANLGIIGAIYLGATHTKWQHALGTYHLSAVAPFPDLSTDDRALLRRAALIRPIGHIPFAYCGEAALLDAALADQELKDAILAYLRPIERTACLGKMKCKRGCLDRIFRAYHYRELYKWLSAAKALDIGAAVIGKDADLTSVVLTILCDDHPLHSILERCAQDDYIQRDAYNWGFAQVRVEYVQGESTGARPAAIENALSDALADFLDDNLYSDARVLALTHLHKKQIARWLLLKRHPWTWLTTATDRDLMIKLRQSSRLGFETLHDLASKNKTLVCTARYSLPFHTKIRNPHQLEAVITASSKPHNIFTYPATHGYVAPTDRTRSGTIRTSIIVIGTPRRATPTIAAVARLQSLLGPDLPQPDYPRTVPASPVPTDLGRSALAFLLPSASSPTPNYTSVLEASFRVIGKRSKLDPDGFLARGLADHDDLRFYYYSSHLFRAYSRFPDPEDIHFRRQRPETDKRAQFDRMFHLACAQWLRSPSQRLRRRFETLFEWTKRTDPRNVGLSNRPGILQETLLFIKYLLDGPATGAKSYWTYPSVSIAKPEPHEIDCIAIWVYDDSITLSLAETTTKKSSTKGVEDARKLLEVRHSIAQNFDDVTVDVKSYGSGLADVAVRDIALLTPPAATRPAGRH